MAGDGALRAWLRAVQPALADTFIAALGEMISATAAFAEPSTVNCPVEQAWVPPALPQSELMYVVNGGEVLLLSAQPADTTYHSGSFAESRSLSMPRVRHGSLPTADPGGTAGSAQLGAAVPSLAGLPTLPAASGQGNRPGLDSLPSAAVFAT